MEYIAHRVNSVQELNQIPTEYGVEIDLRDYGNCIILSHDPFEDGENFEDFLKVYRHGTMILNIKSERIELKVLELLKKHEISQYFFLDCSFPMIRTLINQGEKNIAIRFSEYESIESVLLLKNMVNWVWVDCFTYLPLNKEIFDTLKNDGFKVCIVSPELQNQAEKIPLYKLQLLKEGITVDAICTKVYNINKWIT